MLCFWILSDIFLEACKWIKLHKDKVTFWNFNPGYFCLATFKGHQSSHSRDKKKQTKVKSKPLYVGDRLAWNMWLCGRRYGCDSWNCIANFFFPLGKKVQWNRPTSHWKWLKCWLVLSSYRKLNWLWFFSFKKQLIAKDYTSPCFSMYSDVKVNLMIHVIEQKYVLLHNRREKIKLSLGCLSFPRSLCKI